MMNNLVSSIRANAGRLILVLLVLIVFVTMIALSSPSSVAYAGTAPGGNALIRPTATK